MKLNEYGWIAHNEWINTAAIRNNVELDNFIIMPNHIHGIIRLLRRGELHSPELHSHEPHSHEPHSHEPYSPEPHSPESHSPDVIDTCEPSENRGESYLPGGIDVCDTPENRGVYDTPLRSTSQTIGAIVRGYKSSVTKQLVLLGFNGKLWQRNYHEHIIRDEKSYINISEYITNNPSQWKDDNFFTK